jgi:hypothetical protein
VEHAFDILQAAERQKIAPDTIWVGPSSWVARDPPTAFSLQPGSIPGYLGVAPFRNRNSQYSSYIRRLQDWQRSQSKPVWTELPVFAAEFVDSIVAMTKAITLTKDRQDGAAVVQNLRKLDFEGVSGRVQFTPEGDRMNPQYSIFNAQSIGSNGAIAWKDVGVSGSGVGTLTFHSDNQEVCFPKVGCRVSEWPDDTYKQRDSLPFWILMLVVAFGLLFVVFSIKNWVSRRKLRRIKAELDAFRDSIVGMRAVSRHCIPRTVRKNKNEEHDVEQGLSGKVSVAAREYVQWCWKETSTAMSAHNPSDIQGDPAESWIKYSLECNSKLEAAFKEGKPQYSPLSEYIVNFRSMKQTKVATGYERDVRRVLVKIEAKTDKGAQKEIDLADVHVRDELPVDLRAEPQMVLVEGDIVQISTQRQDGWAFGTKVGLSLSCAVHGLDFQCGN